MICDMGVENFTYTISAFRMLVQKECNPVESKCHSICIDAYVGNMNLNLIRNGSTTR